MLQVRLTTLLLLNGSDLHGSHNKRFPIIQTALEHDSQSLSFIVVGVGFGQYPLDLTRARLDNLIGLVQDLCDRIGCRSVTIC
jgi:hypothetical protein